MLAGLGDAFRVVALAAGRDARDVRRAGRGDPATGRDAGRPRGAGTASNCRPGRSPTADPDACSSDAPPATTWTWSSWPPAASSACGRCSRRCAAGKVVATANKETLVAGGHLVMPLARMRAAEAASKRGHGDPMASPLAWVRPIDSEHSAIWQCLAGERIEDVARLILTASGGPFRDWTQAELVRATPAGRAGAPDLAHGRQDHHRLGDAHEQGPGGHRGTLAVRCATTSGSTSSSTRRASSTRSSSSSTAPLKAQLGLPDMRIPIQYALTYPRRAGLAGTAPRRWPTCRPRIRAAR